MLAPTLLRSGWLAFCVSLLMASASFGQAPQELINRANAAYAKGQWQEAAKGYEEAFRVLGNNLARFPKVEAALHNNLACTYHQLNEYPKAEKAHNRALELRETQRQGTREEIGESYFNRGSLYMDWAKYAAAIKDLDKSLEHGGDKGDRSNPLCQLGRIYLLFADYPTARAKLNEALRLRQQRQGNVAEVKQVLAQVEVQEGNFAQAESLFREILQPQAPGDPLFAARTRNELGYLYQCRGKYAHAREQLQAALAEFRVANLDRANCLLNLGNLAVRLGRRDEAQQHLEEAERVLKGLGAHPSYASCLSSLSQFYEEQGQLAPAAKCAEESVRIIRQFPGHPDEAKHLANLGWVYHALKDRDPSKAQLAVRCYENSLPIWEQKLPNDPLRARVIANAGWMQHNLKNYDAAKKLYEEALRIRAARGDHRVALSHVNLAGLYAAQKEWPEAQREMTKALKLLRAYEQKELTFLPDADQLLFLANERSTESHISILHMALSMALAIQADASAANLGPEHSAEWVLNAKGVAQETLARFELLLRDAGSRFQEQRVALHSSRAELARLALLPDKEAQKEIHQRKGREHAKAEESLIALLADQLKGGITATLWIDLNSVRQALPHDAVLIEMARFRRWDFSGTERDPWREPGYVAWIIPPQGQGAVRLVDLGPAKDLDVAARQLQDVMARIPAEARSRGFKEKPGEEALANGALGRLAKTLLARLEPLPAGTNHLIVSADADLWLVPFAALPVDKGYLVDKYTVSYLVSGRDLLFKSPNARQQKSLVMADAAFGGQGRPFPPLAGTAKEAQAIKKHFPNNAIDIVDGPRASERHYRSLVSPEMLFLCTHGFCLRDLGQEKGLRPNPFNQFGLAFAGANTALIGDTPGREDGIVLGKEVLAADLRGTDLVVLSACKTALAENRSSGEGMASLRQAFHLAGARDVVATLWEVPDQQSAELVDLFVEHLRATPPTPPAQALCKAQRDYLVLQRTPGQAGHTHPFFWAAYGLSGPNRR